MELSCLDVSQLLSFRRWIKLVLQFGFMNVDRIDKHNDRIICINILTETLHLVTANNFNLKVCCDLFLNLVANHTMWSSEVIL